MLGPLVLSKIYALGETRYGFIHTDGIAFIFYLKTIKTDHHAISCPRKLDMFLKFFMPENLLASVIVTVLKLGFNHLFLPQQFQKAE